MNSRTKKTKALTAGVVIESPPLLAEITGRGASVAQSDAHGNPQEKGTNGKAGGAKTSIAEQDRRRLKSLEIFLNNCLNLANAIESKRADKIIQLLTEARDRAIRLRG